MQDHAFLVQYTVVNSFLYPSYYKALYFLGLIPAALVIVDGDVKSGCIIGAVSIAMGLAAYIIFADFEVAADGSIRTRNILGIRGLEIKYLYPVSIFPGLELIRLYLYWQPGRMPYIYFINSPMKHWQELMGIIEKQRSASKGNVKQVRHQSLNKAIIYICAVIFVAIFIYAGGCNTPYRPYSRLYPGGGYYNKKINATSFIVGFHASAATPIDSIKRHLLHRCAELTEANGYEWFIMKTPAICDGDEISYPDDPILYGRVRLLNRVIRVRTEIHFLKRDNGLGAIRASDIVMKR